MIAAEREVQDLEEDSFVAGMACGELRQAIACWTSKASWGKTTTEPRTALGRTHLAAVRAALVQAEDLYVDLAQALSEAQEILEARRRELGDLWMRPGQCAGCLCELPQACPACARSGLRTPADWKRAQCIGCGRKVPTACAFCLLNGYGRPRVRWLPPVLAVGAMALVAYALFRGKHAPCA